MNVAEGGPWILLVEEEAVTRLDLACALGDAGFAVLAVANADHAVRVLSTLPDIKILIADIALCGPADGAELAWMVHEKWPRVRIVAVLRRDHRDLQLPAGSRLLFKPYEKDRLVTAIDELFGHPRSPRVD